MTRVKLSKKVRFEIFKRDHFTCSYCGQKPPAVVLEVDHIIAVANGGTNDKSNLATSCFDCNRGKSSDSLGSVPETAAKRMELLAEREEQEKAFARLLKAQRNRIESQIDEIEEILLGGTESVFTDRFRLSVKHFLQQMPLDRVVFAAERATSKIASPDARLKYFCGICWKILRDSGALS